MKRSFIFLKDFDITISKMNKAAILQDSRLAAELTETGKGRKERGYENFT